MRTKLFLIVISIFCFSSVKGQKAKDVLEDAINMKESQHVLFTKSDVKNVFDKGVEYQILGTNKIGILKDSIMFLVKGELVKTYITPLNPLSYSFESKNELIPDKIDAENANATKEIVTYGKNYFQDESDLLGTKLKLLDAGVNNCDSKFDKIEKLLKKIKYSLQFDTKKELTRAFIVAKNLDFTSKEKTKIVIDSSKKVYEKYEKYYTSIDAKIKELNDTIQNFDCESSTTVFLVQGMFNQNIKDVMSVKKEQYKRVENFKLAINEVEKAYNEATANTICDWCIEIKPNATLEKGKIALYTLTLKNSGYRLTTSNDKGQDIDEITSEESKEISKKVFYFRKFRRFVPEVSSGIAYTNLNFPKFGAVTDEATNELKVAKIGEDNIKRINITAMINYNYYVDNSDIHPFIQLGAGINTDFPTLFLGTGLRFNAFDGGRFAISVGFAGSWIKTLGSLKIGNVVKDDSDVEKDIIYEFAKPKLYYGIQYNF